MTQNIEIDLKKVSNNKSIIITIILLILFALAIFYSMVVDNKYFVPQMPNDQVTTKTWEKNLQKNEPELLKALTPEKQTGIEKVQNAPQNPTLPEKSTDGLNNYRNYLYNVNDLIVRFLENKDFKMQINQLQTLELPAEITKIMLNMEHYRENYLDNSDEAIRIFPTKGSWLEKFIKIEKKSDITIQKDKLKAEIISGLKLFTEYFYSEKLQQKFIE